MRKKKYSDALRRIILRAVDFAGKQEQRSAGTGELLLSVLQEPKLPACRLLAFHGMEKSSLRCLLLCRRMAEPQKKRTGLSCEAKKLLQAAGKEAVMLKSRYVEPEHLLLAMMRAEFCTASVLLVQAGKNLDCIFSDTYRQLMEEKTKYQVERKHNMRLLEQFCEDMVVDAQNTDPVAERETELTQLMKTLCRRSKNNPALIGEPGVGKTAIVEALAQHLAAGTVPEQLKNKRLYRLNMAELLAGTKYRGEFEQRVQEIVSDAQRCGDVLLFVDEMHTLVGAGSAEGAIDAANLLKPALSRGRIQIIGATTLEEYRKHIEKDAALERRFCPICVQEPTPEQTMHMLQAMLPKLEAHHGLRISREAMEAAIRLSVRYLPDRFLPDKALDLLDEGAAGIRLECARAGQRLWGEEKQKTEQELEQALQMRSVEKAMALRDRLTGLLQRQNAGEETRKNTVLPQHIAAVVAERTGIPVGNITLSERDRLLQLKKRLSERIIGQQPAVDAVCEAIFRARSGMAEESRPEASFLLMGPTGVGKTELCKQLAAVAYGSEKALIRVDMTEYMEPGSVTRLIGAPPGYVGYDAGGTLTEKVRRNPYSVILFDEVEKAHPDIMGILLQILDDGRLTDSMGRTVSFRSAMVVMTSNVGSHEQMQSGVGFIPQTENARLQQTLRQTFRPELLGRIDCITVFSSLSAKDLEQIAKIQLEYLRQRCEKQNVFLEINPNVAACLVKSCADGNSGARALRHVIQKEIETPAADLVLHSELPCKLTVRVEEGTVSVAKKDGRINSRTNV